MNKQEINEILHKNMPIIADSLKKKFNMIDIKHGFSHVASSNEEFVITISALLGLNIDNLPNDDLTYLCWVAIPIDESDYVIKVDSEEKKKLFNSTPYKLNEPEFELVAFEYMQGQTEIDEVEWFLNRSLAKIKNRPSSQVFSGMYKIKDNDIFYRRLSYLSSPSMFNISKVYFKSANHKRYNSGVWTGGQNQGCLRAIEIKPDSEFSNSYFVTLFNLEGPFSQWGDNIQIATKRMKIISESPSKITLRGYGSDPMLTPGRPAQIQSNFGITIHLAEQEIIRICYYYHDRDVRLEFLKGNTSNFDVNPLLDINIWVTEPSLEKIKKLVSNGANIRGVSSDGFSVLGLASNYCNNYSIYKYLVESGADVTFVDKRGNEVFLLVAQNCTNADVMDLFVKHGADVNCSNHKGCTVLHHAIGRNTNPEVVLRLYELGADISARDKDNLTIADYCAMNPIMKTDLRIRPLLIKLSNSKTNSSQNKQNGTKENVSFKCKACKRGLFYVHLECELKIDNSGVYFTNKRHPKYSFKINLDRLKGVKFDHPKYCDDDLILILKDGQKYNIGFDEDPTLRVKTIRTIESLCRK